MSFKKKSIIRKRYAWKTLCSNQKLLVTYGKKILLFEKIVMSHNAKYVKLLKRNKVESSYIRGLWKKKKYSEENIVLIHWQILQLLILAEPVLKSKKKKKRQCYWGSQTYKYSFYFMLYRTVWLILAFWTTTLCQITPQ